MGLKVECRQVGKHFSELVNKLQRMDVEKATKEDFWRLINSSHISKMVDDNIRRGTIQSQRMSYMASTENSLFKRGVHGDEQVYTHGATLY